MEADETDRASFVKAVRRDGVGITMFVSAALMVVLCIVFWYWRFSKYWGDYSDSQAVWAQFGDYIGGVLGTGLALINFGILVLSYTRQTRAAEQSERYAAEGRAAAVRAQELAMLHLQNAQEQVAASVAAAAHAQATTVEMRRSANASNVLELILAAQAHMDSILDTTILNSNEQAFRLVHPGPATLRQSATSSWRYDDLGWEVATLAAVHNRPRCFIELFESIGLQVRWAESLDFDDPARPRIGSLVQARCTTGMIYLINIPRGNDAEITRFFPALEDVTRVDNRMCVLAQ